MFRARKTYSEKTKKMKERNRESCSALFLSLSLSFSFFFLSNLFSPIVFCLSPCFFLLLGLLTSPLYRPISSCLILYFRSPRFSLFPPLFISLSLFLSLFFCPCFSLRRCAPLPSRLSAFLFYSAAHLLSLAPYFGVRSRQVKTDRDGK